jgi:hypothetical protein
MCYILPSFSIHFSATQKTMGLQTVSRDGFDAFAFSKKKRQEPSPQLSVSSTSLSAAAGLINLKGEKPMPRHTLISTVGTSLLESNLRRLAEKDFPKPDNWEELYGAFQKENWKAVASKLLELSPGRQGLRRRNKHCRRNIQKRHELYPQHLFPHL